jgi:redox-sensitive bicupin YhaK (pirin superfamily)
MAVQILPLNQHEYYWHGFGAVTEDCCYNHLLHPGLLQEACLLKWSLFRSNAGGMVQEQWIRDIYYFCFVLRGTVEFYDKFRGFKRSLQPGDFWAVDAGAGFLLNQRFSAKALILNLWFSSPIHHQTFHSHVGKVPLQTSHKRADKVKICSYDFTKIAPGKKFFTLQKTKELNLPPAELKIPVEPNSLYTLYLLRGEIQSGETHASTGDFLTISNEQFVPLKTSSHTELVVLKFKKPNNGFLMS